MEISKAKQGLMKCPDLSNTIIVEKMIVYGKLEIILEVNATCAEYFEFIDPCIGVICRDNASCITKGNSFECSCNEGYIKINELTDSSG